MTNEMNRTHNRPDGSTVQPKEVELQGYMEALQIQRRMNKLEDRDGVGDQEQSQTAENNK